MPDYTGASGGSGGVDMYTDAAPEPPKPEAEEPHDEKKEGGEPTAEIPKALLGGKEFKPGEEVMLRVVQVMEDSVLVEYASEEEPHEEAKPEAPAPPSAPNPMSAMMQ